MTERASDTGRVPKAETVDAARSCERLVAQWRRRDLSFDDRHQLLLSFVPADAERVVRAHAALTPVVEPATPQSLRCAKYRRDNDVFPNLGQIQLVRQMMGVAVVSLIVLLVLIQQTDFSGARAETIDIVLLLASNALGGAFHALSTANRSIRTARSTPAPNPSTGRGSCSVLPPAACSPRSSR